MDANSRSCPAWKVPPERAPTPHPLSPEVCKLVMRPSVVTSEVPLDFRGCRSRDGFWMVQIWSSAQDVGSSVPSTTSGGPLETPKALCRGGGWSWAPQPQDTFPGGWKLL